MKQFYIAAEVENYNGDTVIYDDFINTETSKEAIEEFSPAYWNGQGFIPYEDYHITECSECKGGEE